MKITLIAIVTLIFCALALRFWGGSSSSSADTGIKLANSYSLVMQPQKGRQFDFGKSLTYHASMQDGKIILSTDHVSGNMFARRSLSTSMTIDPNTFAGTWVAHVDGISQGGDILLVPNNHGFEIVSKNLYGPYAGKPPAFGQLIALPD